MQICQYGHVVEGHIEINDDHDENPVTTRRLRIPRQNESQLGRGLGTGASDRAYGANARLVYLKCLQALLHFQASRFALMFKCDELEFKPALKVYWLRLIQAYYGTNDETKTGRIPGALDTVSIIYLSLIQRGKYPVYVSDVLQGIKHSTIPFLKCIHLIPKAYREILPSYYIKSLEPYKLPLCGEMYESILTNAKHIGAECHLDVINLSFYYPLVFKTLSRHLLLPNSPSVSFICFCLLDMLSPQLSLTPKTKTSSFPELQIVSFIMMAVKASFLQSVPFSLENYLDILTRYELDSEFPLAGNSSDQSDLLDWSVTKTDNYCQWVYENLVPERKDEELTAMERRLRQIFSLDETFVDTSLRPPPRGSPNSDKYPSSNVGKYIEAIASASSIDGNDTKAQAFNALDARLILYLSIHFGVSKKLLQKNYNDLEKTIKKILPSRSSLNSPALQPLGKSETPFN